MIFPKNYPVPVSHFHFICLCAFNFTAMRWNYVGTLFPWFKKKYCAAQHRFNGLAAPFEGWKKQGPCFSLWIWYLMTYFISWLVLSWCSANSMPTLYENRNRPRVLRGDGNFLLDLSIPYRALDRQDDYILWSPLCVLCGEFYYALFLWTWEQNRNCITSLPMPSAYCMISSLIFSSDDPMELWMQFSVRK